MITENGWPSCSADACDRKPIPGTNITIPLQRGIPNTIMKAFAADFNTHVEPLAGGAPDEGGWTPTNSVATSNHLGGTAMDLNWRAHPMGPSYAGFDQAKIARVRELLRFYEGMIFWGQDWTSPKDSMHFQMGYNTFGDQAKCNDFIGRKIRADGYSTFQRAPADPNTFPLPAGYFYGPLDGPDNCISGRYDTDLQAWKDGLGRWQATLGLPATKQWDDASRHAATVLQKAKGWPETPDIGFGTIHEGEWNAVIRDGWRLPGAPVPEPPSPPAAQSDSDLLRWIAAQLGPGDPSWPPLGMNEHRERLTLRDGLAALIADVATLRRRVDWLIAAQPPAAIKRADGKEGAL